MPDMPPTFRPAGRPSRREQSREFDRRRGSARSRGYTAEWDSASREFLRDEPLCQYCGAGAWGDAPRDVAAALTDHLYPQRQHADVFWVRAWWVACCTDCHNGPKQAAEREGGEALDRLARLLGRPLLGEAAADATAQAFIG